MLIQKAEAFLNTLFSFICILSLLTLSSCATSWLKSDLQEFGTIKKTSKVDLILVFKSNLSSYDEENIKEAFIKRGLEKELKELGVSIVNINKNGNQSCVVDVILNEASSIGPVLTGATLGIIPSFWGDIDFFITIKSLKKTTSYSNTIKTVAHVTFVPLAFFLPNDVTKTREIGMNLAKNILAECEFE